MAELRKMACFAAAGFLGTLLVSVVALPAHSQPYTQPVTVTAHPDQLTRRVPYGDLMLATRAGRHVLMHRVSIAIDQVCPKEDEYGIPLDVDICQHFAWSGARPQIKRAFDRALSGDMSTSAAIELSSTIGK